MDRSTKGQCKNASEVIRVGFRLLEEEDMVWTLKEAIQAGIDSGIAKSFDPQQHLKSLKAQRLKK